MARRPEEPRLAEGRPGGAKAAGRPLDSYAKQSQLWGGGFAGQVRAIGDAHPRAKQSQFAQAIKRTPYGVTTNGAECAKQSQFVESRPEPGGDRPEETRG